MLSTRAPRPVRRALAYAALSVVVGLLCVPGLLRAYPRFANDSHMRTSYSHAVSATFCGTLKTSGDFDLPAELTEHPAELFDPIRVVIERRYGSMAIYCASLRVPRIDSETSLMWWMRAILWIGPGISTAGLGRALAASRIMILVVLCFALSRAGSSVFLTVSVAIATCGVLRALAPYQYNNNPFILSLPLLLVSLYTLLVVDLASRRVPLVAAIFAGLGGVTAFCVNMRTSHAPIYFALFVACVVALWQQHRTEGARQVRYALAAGVAAFVAAYAVGHAVLVRPMERLGGEGIVHHPIAHPLVLALAMPENDLSRREGLKWDDLNGLEIARRIDPSVTYLSPAYERALTQYYVSLWRRHPIDMIAVYRLKFASAGGGVLEETVRLLEHVGLPKRVGRRLAAVDVSGFLFMGVTLATGALGWILYRRHDAALGFTWTLISIGAIGTLLESALIMPRFYVFYHSVLLLYVLVTPAIAVQLVADWLHSRARAVAPAA
jgi:hypothetical protein